MLKRLKKIKKLPPIFTWLLYLILNIYSVFVFKKREYQAKGISIDNTPFLTVTWHNRILFFPLMFEKKIRRKTCAVISASRDGQYLADLITAFSITPIRGSSKKKAFSALNDSIRQIKSGKIVCFTPDGPRGPKYEMSRGPIITASKTGAPILPVSINYSNYWELNTWDSFRIPKPFSRVTAVIGEPQKIPPDLDDDGIEKWRIIIQEKLNNIS